MTATHLATVDGRRIALKWHKLRRRAGDPPFARANLHAGLAAGAVLEVDLVATADAQFVCLHDRTLDAETMARGPVAALTAAELATVPMRGSDGRARAEPVLSLAELAATVARHLPPGGGDGRIQLDLKERRSTCPVSRERLAGVLGAHASWFTLSGDDWAAVTALAVPGLHLGYDPWDLSERGLPAEAVLKATLHIARGARIVYLHHPFLLAALDQGVDPVAALHAAACRVDAWTVDPDRSDLAGVLHRLAAAGVDQITTNDPCALARTWRTLDPYGGAGPA